jgi:hypothetical protein
MASFVLAKVDINYMGGRSGPGSCRKLHITEDANCYEMEESLELKSLKWYYGYPTKASMEVSETATTDFGKYLSTLKILQAAKEEFTKAKQVFEESLGDQETPCSPNRTPACRKSRFSRRQIRTFQADSGACRE